MFQKLLLFLFVLHIGVNVVYGNNILPKIDIEKIRGGRIVGGEDVDIEQFPSQASLHFFHTHICGASLISNRWLITAAHCTTLDYGFIHTPLYGFTVRLGSALLEQGGQVFAVSRVIDHPQFLTNPTMRYDFDISLLYLSRDVTFGPTIQPIRLAEVNEVLLPGSVCTAVGWGYQSEFIPALAEVLQKVNIPLVSSESCESMYNTWGLYNAVTDNMICAGFASGGRDSCAGDSGGPLIADGALIGVTSWAMGCARENAPGVYARIQYFRGWVRENTGV